jgi:hypothetical protein
MPDLHFTVREEIEFKCTVPDSDKVHSVAPGCQVILIDHTPSSDLRKKMENSGMTPPLKHLPPSLQEFPFACDISSSM